ncbi:efflux RND transporter periplasmic adaptor subunit [Variovorax sp. YR752]|uniref:efflux RND transporter periplasmic adaptor subunit n=1 Tax=Variovorax sp. YR752 TaxID=1884383 RepID=UPI003137AEB0
MSRRTIAVLAALALVLAAGVAWLTLRAPRAAAAAVQPAPLVRTLIFSARVATSSRVELGSTLTGRVLTVAVDEGAQVRQGEVLVRLESDELRAALEQARASERQAAARLAGLRSSGRSAAQASVAQADSVLLAAQAELQRTQDLVARGFLSEARLDEARRAVAVAQAQQAGARAQRAANEEQGTDVAQAQAQLALARAAVVAAQARLEQAVLSAPADARVLLRAVEPGQIVQPGRALLTLALSGPVQLVGQLDERYLEQLQIGQSAGVVADAFPGRRFEARVQSIAPVIDAQRGAVEVKLALAPPVPSFLREDMTLSVEVETGRRERALVVPMDALVGDRGDGQATVRVVRDGRVELRRIRLGLTTLEAAEVLEGLAAGEWVLLGAAPATGERVRPELGAAAVQRPAMGKGEGVGSAMTNAMGR